MGTLRSVNRLVGFRIRALDDYIGKICDFYFDDATWAIRYVVVNTGNWLFRRNVLLSPVVLRKPQEGLRVLPVMVTREQVRNSPRADTDKPIALQDLAFLHSHYGWDFYWGAEGMIGTTGVSSPSSKSAVNAEGKAFDPHLRTLRRVLDYRIVAQDGPEGRVEDFLIDDESWIVRSLVIRLANGKKVALPTARVQRIGYDERRIYVNMMMEAVRNCPPANPLVGTTRRYGSTGSGS